MAEDCINHKRARNLFMLVIKLLVSPHHSIDLEFPEVLFFHLESSQKPQERGNTGTWKLMTTLGVRFILICALFHGVLINNSPPPFVVSFSLSSLLQLFSYDHICRRFQKFYFVGLYLWQTPEISRESDHDDAQTPPIHTPSSKLKILLQC
jgi:hypothetical protein